MSQPLAVVRISLAHMAVAFVGAAVDLLIAVEQADGDALPEPLRAAATELRCVVDRGGW